jgi:hypothetical protein
LRLVAPFKSIVPYKEHHIELPEGWWFDAITMLRDTGLHRAHANTYVITDEETELPFLHVLRYATRERCLMTWIVEVSLLYLESEAFDQDTVFISPDSLVRKNIDWFDGTFDIAVTARPMKEKYQRRPLKNGLQWWPLASKERLIALYREALSIARSLSDEEQRWGGDTTPFLQLLGPIVPGLHEVGTLRVMVFPHPTLMEITNVVMRKLREGHCPDAGAAVADFKYRSKANMADYYRRTFG